MNKLLLRAFILESNRIEGILRAPLKREIDAHTAILNASAFAASDLQEFVAAIAPGHVLRDRAGLDVRVGDHIAPAGGWGVAKRLCGLLESAGAFGGVIGNPYDVHQAYEHLHPFTDGNGRSGRVLWLWMMLRQGRDPYVLQRGFLHTFYYQALSAWRKP